MNRFTKSTSLFNKVDEFVTSFNINQSFNSFEHTYKVIERYIHFYNYRRPHMSIDYKIPAVVHLEQGEQKKMWKKQNLF